MLINIVDILPRPPWEGPPLPRFLGVFWPWLQRGVAPPGPSLPALPSPRQYLIDVKEEQTAIIPQQTALATYQNEESWEISWSEDGLPTKIVVHRNAVQK